VHELFQLQRRKRAGEQRRLEAQFAQLEARRHADLVKAGVEPIQLRVQRAQRSAAGNAQGRREVV
jgi:hypothetical protein